MKTVSLNVKFRIVGTYPDVTIISQDGVIYITCGGLSGSLRSALFAVDVTGSKRFEDMHDCIRLSGTDAMHSSIEIYGATGPEKFSEQFTQFYQSATAEYMRDENGLIVLTPRYGNVKMLIADRKDDYDYTYNRRRRGLTYASHWREFDRERTTRITCCGTKQSTDNDSVQQIASLITMLVPRSTVRWGVRTVKPEPDSKIVSTRAGFKVIDTIVDILTSHHIPVLHQAIITVANRLRTTTQNEVCLNDDYDF